MRFHVVSLPHTQVTSEFSSCAFTMKVRRFCQMMKKLGHEVILYAGEKVDVPVDELVTCIDEERRAMMVGLKHYTEADWNHPQWGNFNAAAIAQMQKRIQQKDFICLIGGHSHKPIADAFPAHMSVEFGIGYSGTFAKYRVFESYAWMHSIYAQDATRKGGGAHSADGNFYDAVIPNQFDPSVFYYDAEVERKYFLYAGRMIARKGISIAQSVCEQLGERLILAGPGIVNGYGEPVGPKGPEELADLMRGAYALFVPTLYVEPFGTVSIEAMACGTPVITTDWGVFTETVDEGMGWRCRMFEEFKAAAIKARDTKNPIMHSVRAEVAKGRWGMDAVAIKYERYFEQLMTLWGNGWYA